MVFRMLSFMEWFTVLLVTIIVFTWWWFPYMSGGRIIIVDNKGKEIKSKMNWKKLILEVKMKLTWRLFFLVFECVAAIIFVMGGFMLLWLFAPYTLVTKFVINFAAMFVVYDFFRAFVNTRWILL